MCNRERKERAIDGINAEAQGSDQVAKTTDCLGGHRHEAGPQSSERSLSGEWSFHQLVVIPVHASKVVTAVLVN